MNHDYMWLLDRIEDIMMNKNKDQEEGKKGTQTMQVITKNISTKTSWFNFDEICTHIGRDPGHVLDFFESELDIKGNYGGEGNLILQGKYQNKHIASLYRKYVENYVRCTTCRGMNTELTKDQATRL